jgi:hypothetical protein
MEMGAHHVVNGLGADAGCDQIGEITAAQPMELRPCRPLLVVAEAGIDQDRVMPGPDDEAVKREHEPTGRRVDEPRPGQIRVGPQDLRVEVGKKRLGGNERPLVLGDSLHLEIADPRGPHDPASACSRANPTPPRRRGRQRESSGLDEVQAPLDQRDVAGDPVHPAKNIGILGFEPAEPLFDLDQIGFDLGNIAANGAEVLEDQIGVIFAHGRDF